MDQEPMSEDTSLSSSDEGMWIIIILMNTTINY